MITSFHQAEQFINDRNNFGIKLGLQRMKTMLQHVDNPHRKLQAIHVAGTNGKGSTIHLLEKALLCSDYTVGVFSSPSFTGIRGHITMNQIEITEEEFVELSNELLLPIKQLDDDLDHPTSFEIITVIALLFFQRHAEIVLIETGMGGKDDTTNVIKPLLSIITNIAKDHTQFLGETYEEIATHKAGIIKKNCPIIVGNVNEKSKRVIVHKAKKENAPLFELKNHFNISGKNDEYVWSYRSTSHSFSMGHLPHYQLSNIANVLMALTLLQFNNYQIHWDQFLQQLPNFSLLGRFEFINDQPLILLDSAHNVAAINNLVEAIVKKFPKQTKHVLFSAFKDKDVNEMLKILQENFHHITLTTFSNERSLVKEDLQLYKSKKTIINDDWRKAIMNIFEHHEMNDLFIMTGSLHFIATIRQYIIQNFQHHDQDEDISYNEY